MAEKKIGMINLDVVERSLVGSSAKTIWPAFKYPIIFQQAEGVTFERLGQHDLSLRDSMLAAGRKLVAAGADALAGSCGFMGLFQQDFVKEFKVPCLMSALCQIPLAAMMLGDGDKIGVLAANSRSVDPEMFRLIGIDPALPIRVKGLQDKPHFYEVIYKLGSVVDTDVLKNEFIACARELVAEEPAVKVIVCECTMLPVYREVLQEATGRPVLDWELMLDYLDAAL
jgi:aspartate/glutamate racemase